MSEDAPAQPAQPAWLLSADRPIQDRNDESFGRLPFADELAKQILRLRRGESYVIGLQGPWGAGKTSVLNLIAQSLSESGQEEVLLLQFNPWLFSGTDQLASHFFQEVAAQLQEQDSKELQTAGTALVKYGDALSPLAALPWVGSLAKGTEGTLKALGNYFRKRGGALQGAVSSQKKQIEEMLMKSPKRLLVVVDDIDRLSKQEIRDLFKLVRLTADFPNVSYLLSFDRVRVEEALSDRPGEGRDYLEKILQLAFDLPTVRQPDLARFFLSELDKAIEGLEHGAFDETEWANVFHLVIGPLIKTPRDARRLVNAIPTAVALARTEVALVDLLAIECIRVLLPDVFAQISCSLELLTKTSDEFGRNSGNDDREKFELLLKAGGDAEEIVREFCRRVFPPSRRWIDNHHYGASSVTGWRKEGRLAHPDILRFYLEKGLPSEVLEEREVREVFLLLEDPGALEAKLREFDAEALEHLNARLEAYEDDFPPGAAAVAVPVFLNEGERLREGKRGMFDLGSVLSMSRIVLRLLKSPELEVERVGATKTALKQVRSLSMKRLLIEIVGYAEGAGHKLVDESTAAELHEEVRLEILSASTEALRTERELWRLLLWADDGTTRIPELLTEKLLDVGFTMTLLRSALSERQTQGLSDVASRTVTVLPWEYLCELVDEVSLKAAVARLALQKATLLQDRRAETVLETAQRYASGWRPERDMDFAPSENLGDRKYAKFILLNLLESGVPARRKLAYERVREMQNQNQKPAQPVIDRLSAMAKSSDLVARERCTAIDLLAGYDATQNLEGPLLRQLFDEKAIEDSLASKIAFLFRDRPGRLLDALAGASDPPRDEMGPRFNAALQAVAASLFDDPARLGDELMRRAVEVSQRFKDVKLCEPAVARIQQAFEGEAR